MNLQRQVGNHAAVAVVQRAWLDEQVELVAGPMRASDEEGAVRRLNGYSFDDIKRIVAKLSAAHRKRLKSVLGDFIGRYDVERIRTCIGVVEGGGPSQLGAATEKSHHLIRAGMWAEAFTFLFTQTPELIRVLVLHRLSSGHLRALLENLPTTHTMAPAIRTDIKRQILVEAAARPGFRVSEGREFSDRDKDLLGSSVPVKVRAHPVGPKGNVAALLTEGPDAARYRLTVHTHHDDAMDFVGHAWIEVEELDWPMRRFSWGFWPNARSGKSGMIAGATGQLNSPDSHSGQGFAVRAREGARAQIRVLQGVVDTYAGREYALFGENCATFASSAWAAMTGENLRQGDWFFTSPSDLADKSQP